MGEQEISRRVALGALCSAAADAAHAQPLPIVRHHGVLIRTPDLDGALAFYGDGLGFAIGELDARRGWARLSCNVPIYLEVVGSRQLHPPHLAGAEITFQSNDLEVSVRALQSAGATLTTSAPYTTAVGRSIRFADHAGAIHHMMQANRPTPPFAEPRVYNCGFDVPADAIAPTRALLERGFGLAPMTERYFPPSIPYLEADGSFGFMLHHNQEFEPDLAPREDSRQDDLGVCLVFTSTDLVGASAAARSGGALSLDRTPRAFPLGRRRGFATPGGAPFEIWQWR